MKPTIDLFIGAPIDIDSEQLFLAQLSADFAAHGQSALILANFFTIKNPHQIDFLVVTGGCACHVELKKLTCPVVGGFNGLWHRMLPNNSRVPLEAK